MNAIKVFTSGLFDAIAMHRILAPFDYDLVLLLSMIIASNTCSWFGMIFGVSELLEAWGKESLSFSLVGWPLLWSLLWLCSYLFSTQLYPRIGDVIFRQEYKIPSDKPIQKRQGEAQMGLVLWLFFFIQSILLLKGPHVLPGVFGEHILALSTVCGHLVNCILYSWYAADPYWISSNLGLDDRVALLEKRWLYFLGFGLPFTLSAATLPFKYNLAVFQLFFPLSIVLAAKADSEKPYQSAFRGGMSKRKTKWWAQRLAILGPSQGLTLLVIRGIGALLPKRKKG